MVVGAHLVFQTKYLVFQQQEQKKQLCLHFCMGFQLLNWSYEIITKSEYQFYIINQAGHLKLTSSKQITS